MCPRGIPFFDAAHMVCHCLLIESNDGLVLVDSGFGLDDISNANARLGRQFQLVARPRLDVEETAVRQVVKLGFKPSDVRHIVVTHLDLDHAGGLSDFPHAKVHLMDDEYTAAHAPTTLTEKMRYKPIQWEHGPLWARHQRQPEGERWHGFECVRQPEGLPPEILLIPLPGHTRGHCGVAVQSDKGWLLHAGDQYYYHGEMDHENPRCTKALHALQKFFATDWATQQRNQQRLRELARDHVSTLRVFCAHDPQEFARFA